jgi:neutral ceramidase
MKLIKRILLVLVVLVVLVVGGFVTFIGPWPVYSDSKYKDSDYYAKAIADIDEHAKANDLTATPGKLQAGWAMRDITPPVGTPLAGYSGRGKEKKSEGVRDAVEVTALALSDGKDTVVLVGADMLITPPNIAELVRAEVAERTGGALTGDDILFNASHTHCSVGAFGPGLLSEFSAGKYDPAIVTMLAGKYSEAISEAYKNLKPASLATGKLDLPDYIRNRTREAAVDPILNYLVAKQDTGEMVYLVRYSAHPTIFGGDMMMVSAEYPGELKRYIEEKTQHEAHYLGGAVGSMGPRAPEGATDSDRVTAMGQALGQLVLEAAVPEKLTFRDQLDVASIGVPLGMPQFQLRPVNTQFRVSPLLTYLANIPQGGWLHGARVGDIVFMGMPCDFSGEISIVWREWAEARNLELWTLSFSGTYCGYFSPDKYYNEEPLDYETKEMSWYGPNIEAYFTDLFHHMVGAMTPAA